MRACWLKWVGRDWSISADYIWLNYSGANTGNPSLALNAKWVSTSDDTNVRIFTASGASAQGWKLVSIANKTDKVRLDKSTLINEIRI